MSRLPHSLVRVADFFCGCGGTSAGLRAAGMEIAFGLDFDAEASATFRRNFPEAVFVERDIRTVMASEVAGELTRGGDGSLLLSACAPCQPFTSLRGSGQGRGRRRARTLLVELIPFVEQLSPDFVLVENVPGLEESSSSGPFSRFVAALRRLDYYVTWDVVDCQHWGFLSGAGGSCCSPAVTAQFACRAEPTGPTSSRSLRLANG